MGGGREAGSKTECNWCSQLVFYFDVPSFEKEG